MNKLETYIWKDAKNYAGQTKPNETRLIDMSCDQLQMVYDHCKSMLYNTNPGKLGRLILAEEIKEQIQACSAELTLRWFKSLEDEHGHSIYNNDNLLAYLYAWSKQDDDVLSTFLKVPPEHENTSIKLLKKACRDALGYFNHKHITKSFLYSKLGIYLSAEEITEINQDIETVGVNAKNVAFSTKIENHIKFPLNIEGADIIINPSGLSGKEFISMSVMKSKWRNGCKYSELSTIQLQTLKSKVLYALYDRVIIQSKCWEKLMAQIEEVAKYKQFKLN